MGNKGIFTALSGAIAQSQRVDTIANNIANVNTPGFKKDQQVFKEYLSSYEKAPAVLQTHRIPASIESFYDMQGGDRGYVDASGTYTNFSQGGLKKTGNPLDIAIEGEGFFEVLTPQGIRLSRNGSFTINNENQLVTKNGHLVLRSGVPGEDPNGRIITVQNPNVTITATGGIYLNGENQGQLGVVQVNEPDALQKQGSSMFGFKDNYEVEITPVANAKFHQGYLETSNVNVVQEMTDMIAATRTFESTQKAIEAFDQLNGKLVNEIPVER